MSMNICPSPALSPRTLFHPHQQHQQPPPPPPPPPLPSQPRPSSFSRSSPRASPRSAPAAPTASPKRPFNASSSAPRQPREYLVEPRGAGGRAPVAYVDTGTQYSPDGLPPTAGSAGGGRIKLAGAHREQEEEQQPAGLAKKRKEGARSQSPMSGESSVASSSSGGGRRSWQPPAEPDPRRDPSALQTPADQQVRTAASGKQAETAGLQDEPEEARSTHGHSSAPKRSRQENGEVKTMPRQYWTCNPKDLGVLISNMLMELIRLNDRIPLRDGRLTRFHSRAPPGISVSDYLQRLIQHATLSPPILLSMVYYIDRLCALYSAFTINSLTVHRFLITAATVAAKGLSDSFWTNPTYARIGGIPTTELATLELEFLQKVQWKIVPKPEVLVDYYRSLVERTEGYELEPSSEESSVIDESEEEDVDQMATEPT